MRVARLLSLEDPTSCSPKTWARLVQEAQEDVLVHDGETVREGQDPCPMYPIRIFALTEFAVNVTGGVVCYDFSFFFALTMLDIIYHLLLLLLFIHFLFASACATVVQLIFYIINDSVPFYGFQANSANPVPGPSAQDPVRCFTTLF